MGKAKTVNFEKQREKRRLGDKTRRRKAAAARKEMLNNMTTEERIRFINDERNKAELMEVQLTKRLRTNLTEGRLKICIALDFMDLMSPKELLSLAKQIQWMWNSICNHDAYSVKLFMAPFEGGNAFEEYCRKFGFVNWLINYKSDSFYNIFDASEIVLLSPDTADVLTENDLVDDLKVFVIGGLVDKTVRKNVTKNVAIQRNISCKRLPVRERGRGIHPILNINTVFDILAEVKFQGFSFDMAIDACVPERKQEQQTRIGRKVRRNKYLSSDGNLKSNLLEKSEKLESHLTSIPSLNGIASAE